jgi:hypothetical protein
MNEVRANGLGAFHMQQHPGRAGSRRNDSWPEEPRGRPTSSEGRGHLALRTAAVLGAEALPG